MLTTTNVTKSNDDRDGERITVQDDNHDVEHGDGQRLFFGFSVCFFIVLMASQRNGMPI